MTRFNEAFKETLANEGGYSNRTDDAGGETNFGITVAVARANGYYGPMKDLTIEQAKSIYKKRYWDPLRLDDLQSSALAKKLFDTGVNCGIGTAAKFLQRALNVLNRGGKDWPDLTVDGSIGLATVAMTNKATGLRETNVLKVVNILQGMYYIGLAENPERQDRMNLNGWINSRIKI